MEEKPGLTSDGGRVAGDAVAERAVDTFRRAAMAQLAAGEGGDGDTLDGIAERELAALETER